MREIYYLSLICVLSVLISSTASVENVLPFAPSTPIPKETPEPIDIVTSRVKSITTSPLIFRTGLFEKVVLENTGHTVKTTLNQSTTGTQITGGVFYDDIYVFWLCKFYWTDNSNGSAGTTVNGKNGTPLEIGIFYYNTKYGGFREALDHRDGLAEVIIRIVVVKGSVDNPFFEPFKRVSRKVRDAEATTNTVTGLVFAQYLLFPPISYYFAYPGSYLNESSGQLHYCTTTIVVPLYFYIFISERQFNDTFTSYLGDDGKPLVNKRVQKPQDGRPVVRARNVRTTFNSGFDPSINLPSYLKVDET